jgi:hypothetical protein
MSVWLTIPSARPVETVTRVVSLWQSMGYKVALQRTDMMDCGADYLKISDYTGYARACNALVAHVFNSDPDANFCICAGDDTHPDTSQTAAEIERGCLTFFGGTYGVMQPTGDRWGESAASIQRYGKDRAAYIDRVAGSSFIGRQFWERTYNGEGPFWSDYYHMFVDEELQEVATELGVFWQRRDLTHYNDHCQREAQPGAGIGPIPEFLTRSYSRDEWNRSQAIFAERKDAGWPGAY